MPCKDSSSKIVVRLDRQDRLIDFDFSKITCSKEIGQGTGFKEYCLGRTIEDIFKSDFNEILRVLNLKDSEDQFLLFLEWDALRTSIAQYRGLENEVDTQRYQISSITYDEDQVEISQVIRPLKEMPKIVSCAVQATKL